MSLQIQTSFFTHAHTMSEMIEHGIGHTVKSVQHAYASVGSFFSRVVTAINSTVDAIAPRVIRVAQFIRDVAIFTLTKLVPIALALWYNASLFMIGAFVAIMAGPHMQTAIDRIKDVWKTQGKLGRAIIIGVCLPAWAVNLGFVSFFIGSEAILELHRYARKVIDGSSAGEKHETAPAAAM